MLGPVGTAGAAGAGPRPAGTVLQRTVMLSRSHSHGSDAACAPAAFRRSVPLISFAAPLDVSATQSSIPLSFVALKDSRAPFGEKCRFERLDWGGSATLVSVPLPIGFSVMA